MTLPASGAACPLSSTRRRSMYQLARCPDDSTKSPCTTAFSLITRSRSSRSLTVGEPTQRPPQAVPALGRGWVRRPAAVPVWEEEEEEEEEEAAAPTLARRTRGRPPGGGRGAGLWAEECGAGHGAE